MKRSRLPLNVPVRLNARHYDRAPSESPRAAGPALLPNTREVPALNLALRAPLAGFTTAAEIEAKARRRELIRDALRRHGLLRDRE